MKIKKLHIQNYKSLVNLEILEPNPFTVFAGSNGAGKSNIFEALEFLTYLEKADPNFVIPLFGNGEDILFRGTTSNKLKFSFEFENVTHESELNFIVENGVIQPFNYRTPHVNFNKVEDPNVNHLKSDTDFIQFINNHSRIFLKNSDLVKQKNSTSQRLALDCSNLEKVLARLLRDTSIREDFMGWLDLLIPGFSNIEIVSEQPRGNDTLIIYEKGTNKPFTKNLLSDGTWNILALLTAVYQSDERNPQFLCIEEPENGLNPKVQKELVNLFRQKCEDEGHYIWLNTHSQTIVNQLTPKELILVDKVDGETKIKQLTDFDLHGLTMDEAWLTNSFGGGIPW